MIALALSWPTWGPKRLSLQLAREGIEISTSAVYRLLRRIGLGTRRERLGVLEAHSAESAGLLTQRTRDRLRRGELFTAAATARFLREVLVPHFRKAGWPIQRVLTDRGREF